MSVLLIPNPTKDTGLAVTRQAAAVLAGRGIPVLMPQAFAAADGLDGVRFLPEEQAYRAARRAGLSGARQARSGRKPWPHRLSCHL